MKIQLFFLATIFSTISSLVSFAQQPEIGSFYQGGIVFQLDGDGGGLVCDIQDLNLAQWGCHGTDISGAEGIAIGSGQQNTNEILNGCSQSGIAARLCDNSTSQGFDDWFLPSKDEFMAIDISLVNSASLANGGSTFNYTAPPGSFGMGGAYLTSSEMGDSYPTSYVYGVNISESFFGEEVEMYTTNFSKNEYYYVRAIRAITIYGCIDPAASNYNTSANTDDGSCIVYGCVEPTALNYNSSANTDDGSCSGVGLKTYVPDDNFEWYLEINGMGDGVYNNDSVYTANIHTVTLLDIALDPMDFSMTIIFDLTGIEDFSSLKYLYCDNNLISSLDLSNNFSLTSLVCVGNQISNINVNNCTQLSLLRCGENPISSLDLSTNSNLNELYCYGTQIQSLDVGNCSSLSTLYCHDNPQLSSLNLRNGNNTNMFLRADLNPSLSCINVDGMYNDVSWAISNWTACYCASWQGFGNIDSHHTFSTSCGSVFGCIDSLSCNYDSSATADDGSCLTIYGCMDNSSCNYNSEVTCDDETCYGLLRCTDPSAPNYNLSATCDDESCVSAVLGCMDFSASNYNPLANIEDGSCVLFGCMTNTALNYNPFANSDDGSCISVIFGCTDFSVSNYDPSANTDDGSCEHFGCTDFSASNYDALANTNNGSCEYLLLGCTDVSSSNYDPSANTDDGSCCVTDYTIEQVGGNIYGGYYGRIGKSVSLSSDGSTLAVGAAHLAYGGDPDPVRIYRKVGGSWSQIGQDLIASGTNPEFNNDYGHSVSLSSDGNIVAIGGPLYDHDNNYSGSPDWDRGHVQIFMFNGSNWSQIGQDIDGLMADDEFGYSVSLSGDGSTVAIGAPYHAAYDPCNNCGHVSIYEYSTFFGLWLQTGSNIYGPADNTQTGMSVSLSDDGNIIAIGSQYTDYYSSSGNVRIYQQDIFGSWSQIGQDIYGEESYDENGHSVSLSSDGNIVAIGAPENQGAGSYYYPSGHVRVYQRTGDSWSQIGQDINGEGEEDKFGYSVSLSDDGTMLAVESAEGNSGYTYIYKNIGGSWSQIVEPIGEWGNGGVVRSVSLSGDGTAVAIGSPYANNISGSVRVFNINDDLICPGCTDISASNYNASANTDNGSCEYLVLGCTDISASNYNASANTEDGSCEYLLLGCTDSLSSNYNPAANTNYNCCVDGCTESTALNYNSSATCNDGSCTAIVLGCTDSLLSNYNPAANTNYNCCVDGCMESTALNYNSIATCDDGTCEYDVLGCTDESANNYNSEATVDDDSCQYDSSSNQIISLASGWSSFSSYISPEVSSMDIVLSEVYENLIIAKDYLGQAYLPDWNFNAIGDLNHHQGYQIKLAQEDTLNIEGTYVSPEENPNNLPSGWFMMGYLRLEGVPMDLLLADLVEEQYILIVKDYLGQAYLPDWNFNAIGDAQPGCGYQIKTTQECTLEYLPNNLSYRLGSSLKVIENKSSYFLRSNVTDNNMTLIIEDGAWDILPNQNSEIQALDSENNIVGSALYTSPTTVITLWGDDRYTSRKDGLDINEQVQLKLWDSEEITDFVIKDWVKGSSAYQINAINIASSIITENSTLEANDIGTKSLVRIINLLGQEVHQENIERTVQFLFKVYDDGSVERFIK